MGTKFNLADPNPGVWFKFDEADPDSGEIKIRVLNPLKRDEIQKTCIKNKDVLKNGHRYVIPETNENLFSEMMWDYTIVDWKNLEDDDGNPLPCDSATKFKLMTENIGFILFVSKCLEKLNEQEAERVAMIEKNLSSGSNAFEKNQTVRSAEK